MYPRSDDITKLNPSMEAKVRLLLEKSKKAGLNVKVFEAVRSQKRQDYLYEQGRTRPGRTVTWTRHSRHKKGEAVDMVFIKNGQMTWKGNWDKLIELGAECGLDTLAPREKAHLQDNLKPLNLKLMLIDDTILLLKDLWGKQSDKDKEKIGDLAKRLRALQEALGEDVT